MIVSIHQPSYFPWIGLLRKIQRSDLFILLDEVQLSDSAYQHRNLFLTNTGESKYLTIPFLRQNYRSIPFSQIRISDRTWATKHKSFLQNNYKKHAHFNEVYSKIESIFENEYSNLIDPILVSMKLCLEMLNIKTTIIRQSEYLQLGSLRGQDLVENLVVAANGEFYLSGLGAKDYLTKSAFYNGAEIIFESYVHPVYPQKYSQGFISGLSCLDMLFNVGIKESRDLILNTEVSIA